MKFIYEHDGLGDKLVSGLYVIRPVLYVGNDAEPATFEDFDRYSLYCLTSGLNEWLEDYDTISEAIQGAKDHDES